MKVTRPLEHVLRVFLADPDARYCGYDLMKATEFKSGTLYPMLARLESEGLASSAWEWPNEDGRPPRKHYRLTSDGVRIARVDLAEAFFDAPYVASHSADHDPQGAHLDRNPLASTGRSAVNRSYHGPLCDAPVIEGSQAATDDGHGCDA